MHFFNFDGIFSFLYIRIEEVYLNNIKCNFFSFVKKIFFSGIKCKLNSKEVLFYLAFINNLL